MSHRYCCADLLRTPGRLLAGGLLCVCHLAPTAAVEQALDRGMTAQDFGSGDWTLLQPHIRTLLGATGPAAAKSFASGLDNADAAVLRRCITGLTDSGPWAIDHADQIAQIAVNHSDAEVRWAALTALGRLRDELQVPFLIQALNDEVPANRAQAQQALESIAGGRSATDTAGWRHWHGVLQKQSDTVNALGDALITGASIDFESDLESLLRHRSHRRLLTNVLYELLSHTDRHISRQGSAALRGLKGYYPQRALIDAVAENLLPEGYTERAISSISDNPMPIAAATLPPTTLEDEGAPWGDIAFFTAITVILGFVVGWPVVSHYTRQHTVISKKTMRYTRRLSNPARR